MAFSAPFRSAFVQSFASAGKTRYTLTLQPDGTAGIDNMLVLSAPNANYGSTVYMASHLTNYTPVLKFTLTAIPAGASIVSAILTLTLNSGSSGQTVTIYRILSANSGWTELQSCWNTINGSTPWAGSAGCRTSGTDYSSTAIGSFTAPNLAPTGTAYPVTLDLAEFALLLASNSGLVMIGNAANILQLATSDNANAAYRPKLVVVYDA